MIVIPVHTWVADIATLHSFMHGLYFIPDSTNATIPVQPDNADTLVGSGEVFGVLELKHNDRVIVSTSRIGNRPINKESTFRTDPSGFLMPKYAVGWLVPADHELRAKRIVTMKGVVIGRPPFHRPNTQVIGTQGSIE